MESNKRCIVLLLLQAVFISNTVQNENKCIKKSAMNNFKMDRFLGTWYVAKQSLATLDCNTHIYSKSNASQNSYRIEESYIKTGDSHVERGEKSYTDLTTDNSKPAFMKRAITWNFDPKFLIVFTTDYKNYAGVFMCSPEPVKYRGFITETYVYSREELMTAEHLEKVENEIKSLHLTHEPLLEVDHNYCSKTGMHDY